MNKEPMLVRAGEMRLRCLELSADGREVHAATNKARHVCEYP
jgi:hypothetical protein